MRIGIGQSNAQDSRDYVLTKANKEEKEMIEAASQRAVEAVLAWVAGGVDPAMNEFNCRNTELSSQ